MRLKRTAVAVAIAVAALLAAYFALRWATAAEDQAAAASAPGPGLFIESAKAVYFNLTSMKSVVAITIKAERQTSVDKIVVEGYAEIGAKNATLLNCTIAPPLPVDMAAGTVETFTANCTGAPLLVAAFHDGWATEAVVSGG